LSLLSLTQIAERLGVCRRTIERVVEVGNGPTLTQVSPRRFGVTEEDFQEWFKSLRHRRPARVAEAA
jgi:predicted DNA-binding transcriptional regulator AlpA